ncbi:unnamed protein product [Didymodactylos carnosus]|uniref:NHL repeat-containing protein n=1 Tax=Didymodactylos carnosus TaxID=1234261 RepID=A0A814Z4B0_9BILA|nr:unnamed protein product [Didymodactylos carnosus]CAF1324586.1 unnamed protein product [Didymodactylos carnosus]CAF4000246.1 unnamed protein product [Didymodactylos carnosus]CAF4135287.1 unnamed protein product [Didymodactylos carnosus]
MWNQSAVIYTNASDGSLLNHPSDVAIDSKQNLYVADYYGSSRITKYFASTSNPPVTIILSNYISNLFVDKFDNLYFTTEASVQMLNVSTGLVKTVAGNGEQGSALNQLNNPEGVYVDKNLTVYVSDYFNNRVTKWLPGATTGIQVAGGNQSGSSNSTLNGPRGIFVDEINEKGAIYVCEWGNSRVVKWLSGAKEGIIVAVSPDPYSIIVDSNGIMYISDISTGLVVKWIRNSNAPQVVVGGDGTIGLPNGIKFDVNFNLYVADQVMSRVEKFFYEPSSCPNND